MSRPVAFTATASVASRVAIRYSADGAMGDARNRASALAPLRTGYLTCALLKFLR